MVVVAHRRSGKTVAAVNHLIRAALIKKDGRYAYIAPLLKQAKDISWDYLKYYSQPIPGIKINESELRIDYPNGSRIRVYGADNPDSLRGIELDGVVMDEYGDIKKEMWDAIISPILYANENSWAMFIGTPKGKNDFWVKYIKSKENNDWINILLKSSESGILTDEALEMARANTPQAFYLQEYECDFAENAGAFFRRIKNNIFLGDYPYISGEFKCGVDLAKYQDWTVITPFSLNTFLVYPQIRFNQIDWNLQKARIESEARRYNNARVTIDSTGVGDPIVDDLITAGLRIGEDDRFKFTEQSRQQLLNNLAMFLEQDRIRIPNDEGLIEELEAFKYELGQNGKTKITVPEGLHDDRVMSLALAVWGVKEPIRRDESFEIRLRERRERPKNFK